MEKNVMAPGDVLREYFLKPLGITQNKLALDIRVPSNRINEIINGKRDISVDTAIRFGKYFQTDPVFWLILQSKHDLKMAECSLQDELAYIPVCENLESIAVIRNDTFKETSI